MSTFPPIRNKPRNKPRPQLGTGDRESVGSRGWKSVGNWGKRISLNCFACRRRRTTTKPQPTKPQPCRRTRSYGKAKTSAVPIAWGGIRSNILKILSLHQLHPCFPPVIPSQLLHPPIRSAIPGPRRPALPPPACAAPLHRHPRPGLHLLQLQDLLLRRRYSQ